MSFQFQNAVVNVSGSVTSTPTVKRPNKFLTQNAFSNSTVTLGTVPAGKIWTILATTISATALNTGNDAYISAGGNILDRVSGYGSATMYGSETSSKVYDYNQAVQITAGQTVTATSQAASIVCTPYVMAIEEDA